MVGGVSEASIMGKVVQGPQIPDNVDSEALNGWNAIHPVHRQADSERRCSGIGVRHLRTVCVGAVAEIPVILDRGRAEAFCLR